MKKNFSISVLELPQTNYGEAKIKIEKLADSLINEKVGINFKFIKNNGKYCISLDESIFVGNELDNSKFEQYKTLFLYFDFFVNNDMYSNIVCVFNKKIISEEKFLYTRLEKSFAISQHISEVDLFSYFNSLISEFYKKHLIEIDLKILKIREFEATVIEMRKKIQREYRELNTVIKKKIKNI